MGCCMHVFVGSGMPIVHGAIAATPHRKILEIRQNQPFYAILSHFATHPTRGSQGGGLILLPPPWLATAVI